MKESKDKLEDWLPYFYRLARRHYPHLPAHVKAFYSPEDMVQDAALCAIRDIERYFDPTRASLGTFVCMCANCYMSNKVHYWKCRKRCPEQICSLDAPEQPWDVATPDRMLQLAEAKQAVEDMLRDTWGAAADALENVICFGSHKGLKAQAPALRELARKHHLTRREMEFVLAMY